MPRRRVHGTVVSLLDLRQQGGGAQLEDDAEHGPEPPWPEALKAMTGEDKMDATAIIDYFAPLKEWLDEQNKGQKVGWAAGQ